MGLVRNMNDHVLGINVQKVRARWILAPLMILVLTGSILMSGCVNQGFSSGSTGLTILVDDPNQLNTVKELARNYQNQTGTPVTINQVPVDWSAKSEKSLMGDILIADSGNISAFAADHQLIPLNDHLNTSKQVNWTVFERPSLVIAGEFPEHSGTIYALPFSQDAQGIAFRADLFYDPQESAAFCATYGYPLGVPGTYDELLNLTDFFTRSENGMDGIGFAGLNGSDPISSPWMSIISSYNSGISDRSSGFASGFWNRSSTISGLMMLRNLSHQQISGSDNWNDNDVINALLNGKVAMVITWFSNFPEIQDRANRQNISIGYMPLPGADTPAGSHRGILVRMDGIGIMNNGSSERAIAFLNWFFSPDVQFTYAQSGHQPAVVSMLDSYPYLSLNLFNRAFPESMRVGVSSMRNDTSCAIREECEQFIRMMLSESHLSSDRVNDALNESAMSIDRIILQRK